MKRKIEITIETHEIKTIRIRGAGATPCAHCGKTTPPLTIEQIARLLLEISGDEVSRRIEAGNLHLTEAERAAALIGDDSIKD